MPQTQTSCPRCRRPIVADVEQIFDVSVDPQVKQRVLSGSFNYARCPSCGFEGMLSLPIIYHDPSKELLLTYYPPELGVPVSDQERMIGPLVKKVFDRLPVEQRKAYLLRPQTMLTLQTMLDRILEADGITREMVDAQQKRINLIQRLVTGNLESRSAIIQQDEALIDEVFFTLLSRLTEIASAQGDEKTTQQLVAVQEQLMKETKVGQELKVQVDEVQAAIKSLQEASQKGLTREKLLDLIITAPTETRLNTLVQTAYSGFDYSFFQMLTEKIEQAEGEEKKRLTGIRDKIGNILRDIEKVVTEHTEQARKLLEEILNSPNVEEATEKNIDHITQLFVDILQSELQMARKNDDPDRSTKLQQILAVLEKASAPPPELALVEELLSAKDETERTQILNEHAQEITPEFMGMLNTVVMQSEQQKQPPETVTALKAIYRSALRFSMQANLKK